MQVFTTIEQYSGDVNDFMLLESKGICGSSNTSNDRQEKQILMRGAGMSIVSTRDLGWEI